jgi:hypothetical protein
MGGGHGLQAVLRAKAEQKDKRRRDLTPAYATGDIYGHN